MAELIPALGTLMLFSRIIVSIAGIKPPEGHCPLARHARDPERPGAQDLRADGRVCRARIGDDANAVTKNPTPVTAKVPTSKPRVGTSLMIGDARTEPSAYAIRPVATATPRAPYPL